MSFSHPRNPDLSKDNPYCLERHRYHELKQFCLQYPIWQKRRAAIDGMPGAKRDLAIYSQTGNFTDPTASAADARLFYTERIEMIEKLCNSAGESGIGKYLLEGVTRGVSYDILSAKHGVLPISRDDYYRIYRKFFWMLSMVRQ